MAADGDRVTRMKAAGQIAVAYASFNRIRPEDLRTLLANVFQAIRETSEPAATPKPHVPIKNSVSSDYIICLEDVRKLRTLKRYLGTHSGLTPETYRQKWELPADYPMVAPSYTQLHSQFAKKIGLGRKPGRRRS